MKRAYVMRARAESAQATRRRILDAAAALGRLKFVDDITLEEIAAGSGVAVQTILRIFGSKARLAALAWEQSLRQIREQRSAPRGELESSIRALFDHYEEMGDSVVLRLAEELRRGRREPGLEGGRRFHREWVESQFAPQLARVSELDGPRLVDALVVACDVYSWKLLRRDLGLSREEAETVTRRMVAAVLHAAEEGLFKAGGART
jgi:AcrR family transcriptional regulator